MQKDVVIINGNDGQIPQIDLFLSSLRDPDKGQFKGQVCVVTTSMENDSKEYLRGRDVEVFERRITEVLDTWPFWRNISSFERNKDVETPPQGLWLNRLYRRVLDEDRQKYVDLLAWKDRVLSRILPSLRKTMHDEFELWHRKHLSKLNAISFLKKERHRFDRVLICDADMVIQRPISEVFKSFEKGKVCVSYELEPMIPQEEGGSPVYGSNLIAKNSAYSWAKQIQMGPEAHEVNVGCFGGNMDVIWKYLQEWKNLMFAKDKRWLFVCHFRYFWHEQDFFRLLKDLHRNDFQNIGMDLILHGCQGAGSLVFQDQNGTFIFKESEVAPVIMHFAGGLWKTFPDVAAAYQRPYQEVVNVSCQ